MIRALRTSLGWSCVALALCVTGVGCGDDDDDSPTDAGMAGRGGSGGSGGRGGSGGAGGSVSAAQCRTTATMNAAGTTFTSQCLECACGVNPTVVAGCTNGCWKVLQCAGEKCADKLNDAAAAGTCVGAMCMSLLGAPGALGAQQTGPFIDGPTCSAKCRAPAPTDAGIDEDGGGDAGQ
jgi:hypothetical protein